MIVGIDSMILIYAGVVPSNAKTRAAGFEDLRVRSKLLLYQLDRKKATILLPTIAISELLVPVPKAQKGALIAALTEKFVCPPFDLAAAAIAADLWSQYKELPQDMQYSRQVMRADTMIVASARAGGATDFYSHDQKCQALAKLLLMTAHDLPTGAGDLEAQFLMSDIRQGDL